MGKRVFEVAKELGCDHRDLLKKCDDLRITARNYMSVLSDDDAARLYEVVGGRSGRVAEDRIEGGVRRRRKIDPSTSRAPAAKPEAAQPAAEKPQAAAKAKATKPKASSTEARPKAKAPAKRVPAERKPSGARVLSRPAPIQPVRKKAKKVPQKPGVMPGSAAAAKPSAEQDDAQDSNARAATPGVSRRAPQAAKTRTAKSTVRKPTPRPAAPAGETPAAGAKVLGRIPLEQLRSRTRGPAPRRGGPPARGPAGRGPSGPAHRGPRPPMGGARPGAGGPVAPPPPDKAGDRRRRAAPGARGPAANARGAARPGAGGRNAGRGRRQVLNREDLYKNNRYGRGRRRKMSSRRGSKTLLTTPAAHKRIVGIDGTISVGELGKAIGVKGNDLLRKLIAMGMMVTINQQIDLDTATLLATEYDYEVKNIEFDEEEVLSSAATETEQETDQDSVLRAPVVTIMGHVDHGKTTLLDHIRKANVAGGEAGGITQHIAAYRVPVGDSAVVFLDTPGHAAFTAMRARGSAVTDLVVLVVAADDGVMPQTVESINHARSAGVPLIIAINKIDKPGIDQERIKQELTKYEIVPEEWGGDTMFVPLSALKGTGVDNLLEALALQAEVLELKANPNKPAYGTVIEARIDKGRGPVCTVLVREGTLKKGDYIVAGSNYGRVRALIDDHGKRTKEAGPSTPVEVLGLNGIPGAGDSFHVVKNERDAKKVIASRSDKARVEYQTKDPQAALDRLASIGAVKKKQQNLILKTDVAGSLEALRGSLVELGNDEVEVRLLHSGVGAINDSDITLAVASEAHVIGFNVVPDNKARRSADQGGVTIHKFSIIYDVIDTVKDMLSGLLTPETVEVPLATVEVRAVFQVQKLGAVAGSYVTDGKVIRNAFTRVFRDGKQIAEGKLTTLKRFKDDVKEVGTGYECGMRIDGYDDVREGDVVKVIELKEVQRKIA